MNSRLAILGGPCAVLAFVAGLLLPTEEQRPQKSAEARSEARPLARVVAPVAKAPAPPAAVKLEAPRAPLVLPPPPEKKVQPPAPTAAIKAALDAPDPVAVRNAREGLRSRDPKVRLDALRAVRDLHSREAEEDVKLLLRKERFVPARRVAAQVLALGDVPAHETVLRDLKQDPDIIVQLNACFGLARGGDEVEQALLVSFCEASREAPTLLPLVATALEDPALRSPAVIARFQMVADDPRIDPETRERARAVIRAKRS